MLPSILALRRIAATAAAIMVSGSAFAIPTVYMAPAPTGNDANDGATPGTPVLTFAQAITLVDAGGTINVAAGTYSPTVPVVINKAVSILGPQAGVDPRPSAPVSSSRTQTPGPNNPSPGVGEAVVSFNGATARFDIEANDITIDGLWFSRTAGAADSINRTNNATQFSNFNFRNNVLAGDGFGDDGINIGSLAGSVIEKNYIHDFPTCAIKVRGTTATSACTNTVFRSNEVYDCRISSTNNGVVFVLEDATNTRVEGNLLRSNVNSYAIAIGNTGDAAATTNLPGGTIIGNTLADNRGGINIIRAGTVVQGNTITGVNSSTANLACILVRDNNAASGTLTGIRIFDNVLLNNPQPTASAGAGIRLNNNLAAAEVSGLSITCNSITFTTPAAINNTDTDPLNAPNNYFGGAAPSTGLVAPPPVLQTTINGAVSAPAHLTAAPTTANLSPDDATLDFGPIANTATVDVPVTITNTGDCSSLTIDSPGLVFSGPDAGKYSFATAPSFPIVLAPGANTVFTLRYSPGGVNGPHTATATLTTADSIAPHFTALSLSGTTAGALPPTLASIDAVDADGLNAQLNWTNSQTVTVNFGTIGGGPADTIELTEDVTFTSGITTVTAPFGASTSFTVSPANNAKTIYARINGPGGTSTPVDDTIVLDTVAPVTSITSGAVTNGGFRNTLAAASFTVSFADANPVIDFDPPNTLVLTNATVNGPSVTGNDYTFDVTPGTEGLVSLSVPADVAHDRAGNPNNAAGPYTFTVDTLPPTAEADGPDSQFAGAVMGAITGSGTGTTPTFRIFARKAGAAWAEVSGAVSGTDFSFTPGAGPGMYFLQAVAADQAGNVDEADPSGTTGEGDFFVIWNDVANGPITIPVASSGSPAYTFPLTATESALFDFADTTGGTMMVQRSASEGTLPPGLSAAQLIDERLEVDDSALAAYTQVDLIWFTSPASNPGSTIVIDSLFRAEGGILEETIPTTPSGTTVFGFNLTDLGTFWAGNAAASTREWSVLE